MELSSTFQDMSGEDSFLQDCDPGVLIDVETDYYHNQPEDEYSESETSAETISSFEDKTDPSIEVTSDSHDFDLSNYFSPYSKSCLKDAKGNLKYYSYDLYIYTYVV